jgi:hypothetical protein
MYKQCALHKYDWLFQKLSLTDCLSLEVHPYLQFHIRIHAEKKGKRIGKREIRQWVHVRSF